MLGEDEIREQKLAIAAAVRAREEAELRRLEEFDRQQRPRPTVTYEGVEYEVVFGNGRWL